MAGKWCVLRFLLFAGIVPNGSKDEEKLIKIAASLEMLHSATLIHDDIIDDSPLRRGMPSVESQFGKRCGSLCW